MFSQIDQNVAALYSDFLPKKVFDAHTHMFLRSTLPRFREPNDMFNHHAGSPETYEADMRQFLPGVETIHLNMMPMPDPVLSQATCVPRDHANQYIADLLKKTLGHTGCVYVTPDDHEEQIAEWILGSGFSGIKCYSYGARRVDVEALSIGEYLPEAAWVVADQLHLPIILHLMRPTALSDENNFSYIMNMTRRYPGAQLVLAHCARGFAAWTCVNAIQKLEDQGNIWFDLSSICESGPMIACIMKNAAKRTMWGSDYPICMLRGRAVSVGTGQNWLTDLSGSKATIAAENLFAFYQAALLLNLDQTQLDDLFYRNAIQLFQDTSRSSFSASGA